MMKRLALMLVTVLPLITPLDAGVWDTISGFFSKSTKNAPPTIKPLLVSDKVGVVLEVKGKYKIIDPHTGKNIGIRFDGKRKFIQALKDGLRWGEEFPGIHQLLIVPDEKLTTTIVDGIEYPGLIFVYDVGGLISIVNQVPIEQLLSMSMVQYQKQDLPKELAASLAIAARTTAYYYAENPKSEFWSIEASRLGYQGTGAQVTGPIEKAINATRYMVMSTSLPKDEKIRAFPASWKGDRPAEGTVISQIDINQAREFANKGEDASQILNKAYPGVHIELMQYLE